MTTHKTEENYNLNQKQKKELYGNIVKVALPIAAQSLIGTSLSFVDNLMVGKLGEVELAAVGIGVQIYFIYWMFVFGFSSGCSTFMAQFWGAKDLKSIRKTLGFTLTVCQCVGILFCLGSLFFSRQIVQVFTDIPEVIELAAQYTKMGAGCFMLMSITQPFALALRATHQAKLPLYISLVAFVTNTVLNYMLIFGNFGAPKMGVEGAALATVIARLVEVIIMIIVVFGMKNIIASKAKEFFGWNRDYMARIFKNAGPTMVTEVCWGMGMSLYIAAYARIGIAEFAAVRAGDIIYNLFILTAFSLGDAALILIGQKLGEGKLYKAYPMAKILLRLGVIGGVILGAAMILLAKPMISLFNFSEEAGQYTFYILIIYGTFMPITVFNAMNIVGILRSGGDTKYTMIAETACIYLLGVPIAFITALVLKWPIFLVVLAVKSEELVKFTVIYLRFRSKKWIRNVVEEMDADRKMKPSEYLDSLEESVDPLERAHNSAEGGR